MLSDAQRRFLGHARVAHLATADRRAVPHLVPVCFCLGDATQRDATLGGATQRDDPLGDATQRDATLYITIDQKPKRTDVPLKRLRNIQANPAVAVTVDRWDEDWTRLAWIMLHGSAEILADGEEHRHAQAALCLRYKQYQAMQLSALPVIAVRISRVLSWGALDPDSDQPPI